MKTFKASTKDLDQQLTSLNRQIRCQEYGSATWSRLCAEHRRVVHELGGRTHPADWGRDCPHFDMG